MSPTVQNLSNSVYSYIQVVLHSSVPLAINMWLLNKQSILSSQYEWKFQYTYFLWINVLISELLIIILILYCYN
jgi:hypothetical protein